jgi:hypothetical protein
LSMVETIGTRLFRASIFVCVQIEFKPYRLTGVVGRYRYRDKKQRKRYKKTALLT